MGWANITVKPSRINTYNLIVPYGTRAPHEHKAITHFLFRKALGPKRQRREPWPGTSR